MNAALETPKAVICAILRIAKIDNSLDSQPLFSKSLDSQPLFSKLRKVYTAIPLEEFWNILIECLNTDFFNQRNIELNVFRMISFVCKFLLRMADPFNEKENQSTDGSSSTLLQNAISENQSTDGIGLMLLENAISENQSTDGSSSTLLQNAISYLVQCPKYHRNVRIRVCQFIGILIHCVNECAIRDEKLLNKMRQLLLKRLSYDKNFSVCVSAVLSLRSLQKSTDASCPVTNAYYHFFEHRSSTNLKRAILENSIPLKSEFFIDKISSAITDHSPKVRKSAFVLFSKIPIWEFTISQRIKLLSYGLKDSNAPVRFAVGNVLLPAWLKNCGGNFVTFLESLNVNANPHISISALLVLFQIESYRNVFYQLVYLLNSEFISTGQLTMATCIFWRHAVDFILTQVCENNVTFFIREPNFFKWLNLSIMTVYIRNYYLNTSSKIEIKYEVFERELILIQLLELTIGLLRNDEDDEALVKCLVKDILHSGKAKSFTIPILVKLLIKLQRSVPDGVLELTKVLNSL